jgi:hypothetical protein
MGYQTLHRLPALGSRFNIAKLPSADKVKLLSPHHRFVIALRSPGALRIAFA